MHHAVWVIADELLGAVDGWDVKNYVLGAMFYRHISERLTNYVNITMYTFNVEKSGGKFFTPAAVSELLTRLGTVGKNNNSLFMDAIGG